MLEDQVAFLLQKYLGNYVRGLNKEALKISVWRGDVELTNMQLKPEALNMLKLPVKVKAGFLGSVRIKVPWSKLGQEPVLVYLDRIFLLAEPSTQIEGCSEDAIQEAKKNRIRELELKLLEQQQQLKLEMNTSWLGSLISTIIGNLKLSITNVHVRYEDSESNPGHPFAAGLILSSLSAVTIDDYGKETFATGGALDRIQKSVQLERLAFYFDSNVLPWHVEKSWADLLPQEWNQIFELGVSYDQSINVPLKEHVYILQPVIGNAKYTKFRLDESRSTGQALQQAFVNLDDVTLCLSQDGYRDILKMADNFAAFNQRLKYAHYRPQVSVKSDPRAWWKYAYQVLTDEMKKASGKLSWEQVLRYARIRKRYLSLYASLLKSDLTRMVVDNNEEINKLDRELDIEVILQWRMLAHKFVEQSAESDIYQSRKKQKQSWLSFGWTASGKDNNDSKGFTEEDWERLNRIIGYKEDSDENLLTSLEKNLPYLFLEVHMRHNASKLISSGQECLADLSCEGLACSMKTYSESKIFNFKLESYKLLSPNGLLAESANASDSLVGAFVYKPFDAEVDWSFVAKASPCYMTYLNDSIDQIISFFKTNTVITQNLALETAAAVQMTIDGVKRTAQQQVTQALRNRSRFFLDLDISAPKITIPTNFCPDDHHTTKLLLDLGNLVVCTQDYWGSDSSEADDMYLQFSLILSDVSAFLVDGDYNWREAPIDVSTSKAKFSSLFPVIERCGIAAKLQQIQSENFFYPSTRLAVRLPSLAFHFSPARYHRLMQVAKVFQGEVSSSDELQPWNQSDFEGWLSMLTWKGVGNREAVWQRRYICLVGPFLYILENPESKSYKQYISLRGKQVQHVPKDTDVAQNVLAVYDARQSNLKVEDVSALILLCDSNEAQKKWHNRIQAAIYRASGPATITGLPQISSPGEVMTTKSTDKTIQSYIEKLFITGVLDELRVCVSYCYEKNQIAKKALLGNENQLFEFRAIGGQVELSIREDVIYIGTLLKSLEIVDQYQFSTMALPRYLARSFIQNSNEAMSHQLSTGSYSKPNQSDSEDKFFEASDELDDVIEFPTKQNDRSFSAWASSPSLRSSMKPPSFSRIPGLLPSSDITTAVTNTQNNDTIDSFVKAQLLIYGNGSPYYHNLDNRVVITLATLSFYCYRPTILAILEFVDAINVMENVPTGNGSKSPMPNISTTKFNSVEDGPTSYIIDEPVAKGFLSNGKTRIIFFLSLNMATAQIFLMNEDKTSLATLSQNNLVADIKVFSSSFSIKAALGNLKISDDTLPRSHSYYWACDMRNPEGSSFVELDFSSFSENDEDYNGYDYSLTGKLSEVRIVYLNRFVQEVTSYFMGLVPRNSETFVKLKDYGTNSEKQFPTSEIQGSPALKLDLLLSRPIILMPKGTQSADYLKLDAKHITVQNTFQWLGGDKNEISAVRLDIMTVKVEDINLTVGTGRMSGESIIQDVTGLSVTFQRSLRDLLHQVPATEAIIQINAIKAALSNKEYEIITECAISNISEVPRVVPSLGDAFGIPKENIEKDVSPSLGDAFGTSKENVEEDVSQVPTAMASEDLEEQKWITIKVLVSVEYVELSLHSRITRDSPLASLQATGAWVLYKSNSHGDGFLFATLKGFSVIDAREGIKEELRLAIGKSWGNESTFSSDASDTLRLTRPGENNVLCELSTQPIPSMLILDATFKNSLTNISLCVQRPKLLVVLDFLLAISEFFVPSLRSVLSDEEEIMPSPLSNAVIIDQQIYFQPSMVFSLSPLRPLLVDDEKFEHFIYDGKGGKLFLQSRDGKNISEFNTEIIIHVGDGKRLQFKNVTIVNGHCLDTCIFLGSNSSYSASEDDKVFFGEEEEAIPLVIPEDRRDDVAAPTVVADGSTELVIELQAIGPELTFYNASEEVGRSLATSNKAIHAYLDAFCRLVVKDKSLEMNGNVLGLKMESNGIRILEPFDTSMKFSNTFGRSNIHLAVSDIFLNLSFSILKLFLAVEEDILAFLRRTSKKVSVVCFQFDKVGAIQSNLRDQKYTFWRPRAPSGFAVLGDCLTPLNEPPAKGVLAVNTSFAKVKRPVSYRLISSFGLGNAARKDLFSILPSKDDDSANDSCSVWFPVAPKGYVAVGCVVSPGSRPPSLSSALCILSSLVTPCTLKDCIAFQMADLNGHADDIAFWRVDNSFGSFLPFSSSDMSVDGRAYEFRHMIFEFPEQPAMTTKVQNDLETPNQSPLQGRTELTSGRLLEVVASFRLIWWNQGTDPHKRLSIWRPVVPHGMVFLGDIAVQGYEPPNLAIVLHDTVDEALFKCPQDFQLLGRIKKNKGNDGIYFWMPLAPPGYVAMGCVACKGPPKGDDLSCLRCIRNDMVTGDQFPDESLWDTSVETASTDSFSLWSVGHEVGTFIVRKGFKKPPKRFALKLAGPNVSSGSDGTVLDAELKNFSVAVFDDYEGLMVPLFNVSLGCIGLNFYGRSDYMNSTVNFSLASRSYNDKYDDWEPLIEPTDGFLRYQYDLNRPGAATQIRVTFTKDLTLNMSVSNLNLMFQAYASWCNLILVDESSKMRKYVNQERALLKCDEASIIDIHRKKKYFIIPQNQLGQDIYIRATENDRLSSITKMPSGDNRPIKVPVSKSLLNSHMDGKTNRISQSLLTVVISEAELPIIEAMASAQYSVAVRLFLRCSAESSVQEQSARTCGASPEPLADVKFLVKWNEIFFFKVDFVDNYIMEFTIIDMGRRGEPIGIYSSSLEQIVSEACSISSSNNSCYDLTWRHLSSVKRKASFDDVHMHGRIRCAVLLSAPDEVKKDEKAHKYAGAGVIQISPAREGPWTTVRLNYASPAACWRLGDDVVASEVTVTDGNRFVSIRSLVSVTNNTDFVIDLCLKSKNSSGSMHFAEGNEDGNNGSDGSRIHVDEFFETEEYSPSDGWHSCSLSLGNGHHQEMPNTSLPDGWEWIDEWHVDDTAVEISDGWVYAPDTKHLKWPETYDHLNHINFARQRRWIRHKKYTVHDLNKEISVGLLEPGHTIPLPLCGLVHPVFSYFLKVRPKLVGEQKEYSWSSVLEKHELSGSGNFDHTEGSEICVSELTEADTLLYCSEKSDFSTDKGGLWFCLTIQAEQIGKDIRSEPIHDWKLVISSALSINNYLPLSSEYAVIDEGGRESASCSQGVLFPGKSAKIYNADVQGSLYLSILPQGGWELIHEPIPITRGSKISSMTMNLRNSFSGRLVMVIVDQSFNKDHSIARSIRIYVPYWIESARCPPLTYNFVDRKEKRSDSGHSKRNMKAEKVLWQITNEEMTNGYTIVSALNFKYLGLSVSLSNPGKEKFGPVKELSPLGDMDGSIDLYAYDADGNSMRIFILSKPSPYEAVPTKVILVRPFMAFTNRLGQDLFIILNSEDQPKVLHASDTRVAFVCSETGGQEKIQVHLQNTNWCLPFEIANEDTLTISLKMHHGVRKYLRAEIRGYEEGSRFLVVFRMEPERGPIRIENRMANRILEICQSGLADDDWIKLEPLSSTNFSWDDPFGQRSINVRIQGVVYVQNISLEEINDSRDLKAHGVNLHVEEAGEIKFVRFIDEKRRLQLESRKMIEPLEKAGTSTSQEMQSSTSPLELIIELGIVGISLIDHKPRELLYLYLEKVFASFSTGYDAGKTSRFKLIVGKLQLDNQLPLTIMPVLLAPEEMPDINHPVFKATFTLSNDNMDGTQIFPYVYARVTDKCWRINVHEPVIWALVDFYSNLRLYSTPNNLDVTQVDPEIRFDLIDVSEIRLKLSLETSPNQRPHGALGIWGPILSTVGNAFKLQLHLRKVVHKNRFMRRSSIFPAIVNRIKRDLIHNPLHVIFSVDVLGMTKSTLASLSKGFAELSTDRQFLQLRSKQVWSRRITGFSDGFLQGTEAFAQGVAFGVTGVLRKPVENARQHGFLGLAHGLGRAFLGFVVQPLSGALDFVSLTVDGVGASFSKCLDILSNKATAQRIRYPRAIRANGIIEKYSEREAIGQMILYLAEASRHLRCADLFKEPSKYAWSDYYEDHFIVPFQRIVLITNKRVMLLQALSLDKLAKKPSKILWDVPWDELLALELAKAGHVKPSHLIIHLKHFKRSESFVRIVRCNVDEEGQEPQAVVICSCIRRMWKAHQADMKFLSLKVPSSQRYVQFADETSGRDSFKCRKPVIKSRGFQSASSHAEEMRFKKHCVNFQKIWSSEQEYKSRCTLFPKQVIDDGTICSIWRPLCPNGYVSVGDVAHIGIHQPHVAAVYKYSERSFSLPVGYDLVWRNCASDYGFPLSIWLPRPPDGFAALGCVAVAAFEEPPLDSAYCVSAELAENTEFEQMVWAAPDSYPWACFIYQAKSEALQFVALRQPKEESDWRPMRVSECEPPRVLEASTDPK